MIPIDSTLEVAKALDDVLNLPEDEMEVGYHHDKQCD
jgi:hypothetical protein